MVQRRAFLELLATGACALAAGGCGRSSAERSAPGSNKEAAMTTQTTIDPSGAGRMPVMFAGHGSPMNVIEDNRWSRGFTELGRLVRKPKAILAVSAHWFVRGIYLTANPRPRTIHDFHGFPKALFEIEYPAAGKPELAQRVASLLGSGAAPSHDWGFDHGTWGVLRAMFPAADVPVIQLSIDQRLSPQQHFDLGRSLAPLRDEGVLILGSGNIVHNLRDAIGRMQSGSQETPDWALRFDTATKKALEQHDAQALLKLWPSGDGQLAHPSPDHFFPLLYALGASSDGDRVRFPAEGFDLGSVSMRNVIWGS
ncbi:MAG TPA: 4,5-DOPA dioxygenase extradiol [Polyangiaceae bacterium]|nr:4,5-DOPA dioxygenase extradiol [Polyangiaceae bacterium]